MIQISLSQNLFSDDESLFGASVVHLNKSLWYNLYTYCEREWMTHIYLLQELA